jgi:hypothetical protein
MKISNPVIKNKIVKNLALMNLMHSEIKHVVQYIHFRKVNQTRLMWPVLAPNSKFSYVGPSKDTIPCSLSKVEGQPTFLRNVASVIKID